MELDNRKPFKVKDITRHIKKAVVARSLDEIRYKVAEKFNRANELPTIHLDSDGTEIDDEEYFRTLDPDTELIAVFPGEHWIDPSHYVTLRNHPQDQLDASNKAAKTARIKQLMGQLQNNVCNVSVLSDPDLETLSNMDPNSLVDITGKDFMDQLKDSGRPLCAKRTAQDRINLLKLLKDGAIFCSERYPEDAEAIDMEVRQKVKGETLIITTVAPSTSTSTSTSTITTAKQFKSTYNSDTTIVEATEPAEPAEPTAKSPIQIDCNSRTNNYNNKGTTASAECNGGEMEDVTAIGTLATATIAATTEKVISKTLNTQTETIDLLQNTQRQILLQHQNKKRQQQQQNYRQNNQQKQQQLIINNNNNNKNNNNRNMEQQVKIVIEDTSKITAPTALSIIETGTVLTKQTPPVLSPSSSSASTSPTASVTTEVAATTTAGNSKMHDV